LANLAYKCFQNDKYRPETCCVIGNYYGLKGDHAKAVVNFKRAIQLDHNFLPAWTLMGHEYLEMKSIPAAIECYRSAVDIDPSDYRAWYGLGQTYELHQMYTYAIYYFLNAAKAKPNDSRMWTALGSCYEKLEKKNEALKCYEKAIAYKDKEGIALFKIAKIYQLQGDEDKAASCFMENLKKINNNEESENVELIESYLYLAKYYKKKEDYKEAYNYLLKLKDHEGPVLIINIGTRRDTLFNKRYSIIVV
jgi:anaphase-promoting complex subunit 8